MKAAQINEYGGPEVLKLNPNASKPVAGKEQVLVEVYAAALNPWDKTVRSGKVKDSLPLKFPATLGGDLAGVVSELGPGVNGFNVGEEVYGQAGSVSGEGSFAEFTPVKTSQVALKPKTVDFIKAAALPLAATSAYQALVDHIGLKPGQKILITGGAGGIGSFAVQIAKHIDAHVITTVKAKDVDFVKSIGADEAIDYETQDVLSIVRDLDAIFDTAADEKVAKAYQLVKPGGVVVSMIVKPDEASADNHEVTALLQSSQVTTERLKAVTNLVDSGALKVNVDKVFPIEQAGEAQAYLESGQHRGKVVLKVK